MWHYTSLFADVEAECDVLFSDRENLTKIDLSSVENIGANAFANCIGLNDINLENVKSLGEGALKGCTSIYVRLLCAWVGVA